MMADNTTPKKHWIPDLVAGVTTGIANIPDAMASAILAGTNPVYGLYATMVGTPVGGLLTSSQFMSVATTSATALIIGSSLIHYSGDDQIQALFTLALMVGLFAVLAGVLKLGKWMRYVSNSVMIGFLTGVSVVIVLSQLGDLTGYSSQYTNKVRQAIDLLFHLNELNLHTVIIGLITVVLIIVLYRTRLRTFSLLLAMLVTSAIAFLTGWGDVQTVADVANIPGSLPLPKLPQLSYIPGLVMPALSITVVALVQGAGVSKSYANPDGRYPDVSRDFFGTGIANAASSLFQGMPVGGSVGASALNVSAGAKTRWANIFSGLVVAIVVVLFSRIVGYAAMPAMAALIIVSGLQSFKADEIHDVWVVGAGSRVVMAFTFIVTLILPVQQAVLLGVLLSIVVYFLSTADVVRVVELVRTPQGTYLERQPPEVLPDHQVTILQIQGNIFFAAVDKLETMLPSARGSIHPVVILRLRGYQQINSTFVNFIERYSDQIDQAQGRLMLVGVNETIKGQLERTGLTQEDLGEEDVFLETDELRHSLHEAEAAASKWLDETGELSDQGTEPMGDQR
jgi:SulP family sulfate permease